MKTKTYALMRTTAKNNQEGFTLIEVLIAMAIFAVGILALAGLQVTYIGGNASAQMQTEATALGAQVIEHLKSLPFDAAELDSAANPHQPPAGGSRTLRCAVDRGRQYTGQQHQNHRCDGDAHKSR